MQGRHGDRGQADGHLCEDLVPTLLLIPTLFSLFLPLFLATSTSLPSCNARFMRSQASGGGQPQRQEIGINWAPAVCRALSIPHHFQASPQSYEYCHRWGKLHSERSFSSKVTQSWSQYLDIGPLHCRARLHSVHCCILEGKNNKKDPSILYQQYVPTHPRTFTPAVAYVWNMLSSLCLALSQTWYWMYLTSRVTWALTN